MDTEIGTQKLPAYAVLILPVPIDRMFTYFIPEKMRENCEPGKRVIVQFGARRFYTAIIYSLAENVPEGITPKPIEMILDDVPVVNPLHLKFWKWISDYYLCGPGDVLRAALPAGLRIESKTTIELNPECNDDMLTNLHQHEQMIYNALLANESLSVTDIQKMLGIKHVQHIIKNLLNKGVATSYEEYSERFVPKKETFVSLSQEFLDDETKLLELSNSLTKKAPKQSDVLIWFIHETTVKNNLKELPKKELTKRCSQQAIQSLIKKRIFIETEKIISRFSKGEEAHGIDFTLTNEQQKAFLSVRQSLSEGKVHLLHGITSSGKTEIYISLMQEELTAGRQVLYLLPEIALTAQIVNRLLTIFGEKVGVYHHKFNYNEKVEIWNSVAGYQSDNVKYQIIIGTRSALFLPFINLGLIIVDEEHDSSYKQNEPAPRYHARDSAIMLATLMNAKVLLGTATPSIETYFNVQTGKYTHTEIFKRYGDLPLPQVEIVDITKERKVKKGIWYISKPLKIAIDEALENKNQVILFHNRRGFAIIVQCTQCGWIPGCKHCDITLTYHKKHNHLKCHLCGYFRNIPEMCPVCQNAHIKFLGYGTEKVEEEIKVLFPNAVVARMDTDTTRGKYSHQNIISAFEKGETNILVGTQMVSKGLNFEKVSTVGILNADSLMHFPEFRAFEKGFQILTQIMGRSGRHHKKGIVILQTCKPKHIVIKSAINNNFLDFYNAQIKERKLFRYPPFYRLILLSVQHKNQMKANSAANKLKKIISKIDDELIILGPEEPIYGKIKKYYIRNILIKIPRTEKHLQTRIKIRTIVNDFIAEKEQSRIYITADADPQ